MTRELLLVDAADPSAVFRALRAALGEHGPAVLPVEAGTAVAAASRPGRSGSSTGTGAPTRGTGTSTGAGTGTGAPTRGTAPDPGAPATVAHDIALVIETSGSTGRPKRVALTADALLASAGASAAALGGEGQWLLALPAHYIAGVQVLVRSLAARTDPVLLTPGHFDPIAFANAALSMTGERRFVSLVPVQLARLLDAADEAHAADAADAANAAGSAALVGAALRSFDRILVGGQAMPPALIERAGAAGARVVRTYGSSETAGGCVYDGLPIGNTRARSLGGLLELAGPSLASEYLGDPERTAAAFHLDDGARWYRTGDLGEVSKEGRVTVLGRADNVIISGGEKVSLEAIERLAHGMPGLSNAVVVAAPSVEWGQVPVLVVSATPHAGADADAELLEAVRTAAASALGVAARPARILRPPEMPLLPSGKPDRRALTARAALVADPTHTSEAPTT